MKQLLLIMSLILIIISSTGCSIIGIAIGDNIDSKEVYYKKIESDSTKFESLELVKGDSIKIVSTDGDTLAGIFIQYQTLSVEEYTKEFIDAFGSKEYFPKQYDTLWTLEDDNIVKYEFLGFEYKNILVKDEKNDTIVISLNESFILLEEQNQIFKEKEFIEFIEFIKDRTEIVKSVSFHRYLQLMELFTSQNKRKILMTNLNDTLVIPIDDIFQIVVFYYKNYALEGFLVGFAIDVIIISIIYSTGFGTWNMQL